MECAEDKFRVPLDIEPINVVKNEPLSNFFTRFNPVYGALALLFMGVIIIGATTYVEGTLFPGNPGKTRVPLMKDVNDIALIVGYLPGLFFVSLLYYKHIKKLQIELFQYRVVGNKEFNSVDEISKITDTDKRNREKYISFLKNFCRWYCSPWVTFGCIVITIIVTYFGFLKTFLGLDTWHTRVVEGDGRILSVGGTLYTIFIFALYIYLFANLLYRGIVTTILVYRMFKNFTMNIEFLHPDKCGGLKIIGDLANTFNFAVFIGGLNVVSLLFTHTEIIGIPSPHYTNMIPLVAYIVLAPMMFFGTLYATHKKMKETKMSLQRNISVKYDILFKKNHSKASTGNVDTAATEQLTDLEKAYETIEQVPEWPIHISMIRNLFGTLLIPIVTHFSPNIINIINKIRPFFK